MIATDELNQYRLLVGNYLAALSKFQNEDTLGEVCDHIANGGSLIQLAKLWDIPYSILLRFLRADPIRRKAYEQSLKDRQEWAIERLLTELKSVSCVDMTQIIDKDGVILPTESWPDDVKQNLKKIRVVETFEGVGQDRIWTGYVKDIEFHDKLKAIDMYGKQLKMWTDPAEKGSGASLPELLMMAKAMKSDVE